MSLTAFIFCAFTRRRARFGGKVRVSFSSRSKRRRSNWLASATPRFCATKAGGFRRAGKFIERADKTSRILDIRHRSLPDRGAPETVTQAEALDFVGGVAVMQAAWDAYKSLHGAEIHPRYVAEFLLFNDDFPRSGAVLRGRIESRVAPYFRRPQRAFFKRGGKTVCHGLAGGVVAIPVRSMKFLIRGFHLFLDQFQEKLNANRLPR